MPCNDSFPPSREQILDEKAPALLCALIRALGPHQLNALSERADWLWSGVTREELFEWWRMHQARDAKQRADEEARNKKALALKSARAKLNAAEREAVGLAPDDGL